MKENKWKKKKARRLVPQEYDLRSHTDSQPVSVSLCFFLPLSLSPTHALTHSHTETRAKVERSTPYCARHWQI